MKNQLFKKILVSFLLFISVGIVSGQSLKDNPDYRKSVELKRLSEVAYEDGDYSESTRLANESVIYAQKSDQWIAMMLSKYRANSALKKAKTRIVSITRLKTNINFPEALEEGKELYDQANSLYTDENYTDSYPLALQAIEVMKKIEYVTKKSILPAAYLVMDVPGDEDSLSKISGYEFVFGDISQWKEIYKANKDILPQSENPDLIVPGMVLKIPSLNGEERYGTWIKDSIQ